MKYMIVAVLAALVAVGTAEAAREIISKGVVMGEVNTKLARVLVYKVSDDKATCYVAITDGFAGAAPSISCIK